MIMRVKAAGAKGTLRRTDLYDGEPGVEPGVSVTSPGQAFAMPE